MISAARDNLSDAGESVELTFTTLLPPGVDPGATTTATVRITDVSAQGNTPSVSFETGTYRLSEGATTTVKVRLSVAPGSDVTIPITATPMGGATSTDYSGVPASVTYGSSDTEASFTFVATQDSEDDDGESVALGFGDLPGGIRPGALATTTIEIADDDVPSSVSVSFTSNSYSVSEGATTTITVTLDKDPGRTVVVPLEKTGQGGVSDVDYSGVPSEVTFNSGETEKTFTFSATQDIENDDGESVRLSLGSLPSGVTRGSVATTTVAILDDDDPIVSVSFRQSAYTVSEGSSVPVSIQLSREPESTVTVPITVTPEGDATAADYSIDPVNVTFSVGQTVGEFTFSATQDDQDDDGDSVALGVGELPGGVTIGATATSRVSILDDDERGVIVSPASIAMIAGNSNQYTLVLNSEPIGDVTVEVTGHDATDLTVNPQRLTFNAGNWNSPQTVMVTANHDADSTVVHLSHTVSGADYDSTTAPGISRSRKGSDR